MDYEIIENVIKYFIVFKIDILFNFWLLRFTLLIVKNKFSFLIRFID